MAKVRCSFCNEECELKNVQIKKDFEGKHHICYDCYRKTGIDDFTVIVNMTAGEIRPYIENADKCLALDEDYKMTDFVSGCFEADLKNQFILSPKRSVNGAKYYHRFSDITGYEFCENDKSVFREDALNLLENDSLFMGKNPPKASIFSKNRNCYCMKLTVFSKNISQPKFDIILLKKPAKFNSSAYDTAKSNLVECVALMEKILNEPIKSNDIED